MDTLHEIAQTMHNGELMTVVERMRKKTPMLEQAPWYEATDRTSHSFAYDTSLPAGTWTNYNEGVPKESWTSTKDRANLGRLKTRSEIDYDLYQQQTNPDSWRSMRDLRFAEGLGQTMSTAILYADEGLTPNSFNGIFKHYPAVATEGVYNMGGTSGENGQLTDIVIVDWGPEKVYLAYPYESDAMGYMRQSFDPQPVEDGITSGNKLVTMETYFQFVCGLVVENPRCVKRITNVNTAATGNGAFDEDFLIEALEDMEDGGASSVIYMPRIIRTRMAIAAKDRSNILLNWENVFGRRVLTFWDRPVYVDESITFANNVVA